MEVEVQFCSHILSTNCMPGLFWELGGKDNLDRVPSLKGLKDTYLSLGSHPYRQTRVQLIGLSTV